MWVSVGLTLTFKLLPYSAQCSVEALYQNDCVFHIRQDAEKQKQSVLFLFYVNFNVSLLGNFLFQAVLYQSFYKTNFIKS